MENKVSLKTMSQARTQSKDQTWRTPRVLFRQLDAEFGFTLDAAADEHNALCPQFYSARDNALWHSWADAGGAVWLNPPYYGNLPLFMEKAYLSATAGATVVCLVPARTDTRWWTNYAMRATEIRFIRGRLRFNETGSAPFPSALIVYCPPLSAAAPRLSMYHLPPRETAHDG